MKTVIITGASTGIGKCCALYLDRRGWKVFAGVRRPADAQALTHESTGALTPVFVDVTDSASIAAAAACVTGAVGKAGLDGLVNNAGIGVGGPLEFIPISDLRKQLEINVIGQIAVTQAFLPLIRSAGGRIINMSSISGRVAMPFVGPYAASKFALEALTDSLRNELHPWGIKVVSIQPGSIDTPIWDKTLASSRQMRQNLPPQSEALYGTTMDQLFEAVEKTGRRGIPSERVAQVVYQALTVSHPKTRYRVGVDARLAALLVNLLPDRLLDWLIRRYDGIL